jgi:hypothetical protein
LSNYLAGTLLVPSIEARKQKVDGDSLYSSSLDFVSYLVYGGLITSVFEYRVGGDRRALEDVIDRALRQARALAQLTQRGDHSLQWVVSGGRRLMDDGATAIRCVKEMCLTESAAQYDHMGRKYNAYARTATLKQAES